MSELEFWSTNRKFGLQILQPVLRQLLAQCRAAADVETGGILIGEYTTRYDCAVVQRVTGPTPDSSATRTRFRRGIQGLQPLLDRLWKRQHRYYLGEWHYHPGAGSFPSAVDMRQLTEIAGDTAYQCPEPVLLIIGGSPPVRWEAAAFVFPRDGARIPLRRVGQDVESGAEPSAGRPQSDKPTDSLG